MHTESPTAWIAFGEVRHKRLSPLRHGFSYPAFFLRIPIHLTSGQRMGGAVFGVNRPALLSFYDRDHGDGSGNHEWLYRLLADAGLPAPDALWLHAFPRILGYVFKPVSFWFCDDSKGQNYAIVAEVHNTFGERHCYLIAHQDGSPLKAGHEHRATKAFHVSPFFEVAGSYRFRFLTRSTRSCARVDYDGPDGQPLLTTSMSGTLQVLDRKTAWRALLQYPFFTLGVIVRIHWQALKLWRLKIPFVRKPPAPEHFVTRGSA